MKTMMLGILHSCYLRVYFIANVMYPDSRASYMHKNNCGWQFALISLCYEGLRVRLPKSRPCHNCQRGQKENRHRSALLPLNS